MIEFTIHTKESAPSESVDSLTAVEKKYGFIPNLTAAMASAPQLLKAYVAVGNAFEEGSLTPVEQQVVTLTVSYHNNCVYCMSGHSMLAEMAGMDAGSVKALREGRSLPDGRLEALRRFTASLLERRGQVEEVALKSFFGAGYSPSNALDVLVGIAFKTLSNYTHALQPVTLDQPVEPHRWTSRPASTRALIVGQLEKDGSDALAAYQSAAGPIMARHGGKPIFKAKPSRSLVGDRTDMVVLMEFPSAEALTQAFADPEYTKLLPLRDRAFAKLEVVDLGGDV